MAVPAHAQLRGRPVIFEPTYAPPHRIGVQVGTGGELHGITVAAEGTRLFGNSPLRRHLSLGVSGGFWEGSGHPAQPFGTVTAQLRLDPAPPSDVQETVTIRAIAGIATIRDAGHFRWSMPLGIGAGAVLTVAGIHLEPWLVPHITLIKGFDQLPPGGFLQPGSDDVQAGVSAGVTLRVIKHFTARFSMDRTSRWTSTSSYLGYWF